ncbi:MAG: PadR family transcriptional regulator [Promethearchaeota archaeon]
MRTHELRKTILRMAGTHNFYGYEIHQRLAEKGIKIGIGRLYSILGEMKSDGLLNDRWEESSSGPKRRVYHVAPKGGKEREGILMDAIKTVHDFYIEYLLNLPPELSAFNRIATFLTKGTKEEINIGCAAPGISSSVKRLMKKLQENRPKANVYTFCPKTAASDLDINGILALDGSLEDIPTKDGFLDLLVVTGNIRKDCLDACIAEWRRVIHPKGRVALVTPTAIIADYKDPLGIGEFIEMREHPPTEGDGHLNIGMLRAALEKHFRKIREERVVHVTALTGSGSIS